ncbi:MAG: C40 family peptidase, partial [Erysipelotrichaceae bacterium]|nr:C40 family peptidase [Erysipelotrichaceae bacterium]
PLLILRRGMSPNLNLMTLGGTVISLSELQPGDIVWKSGHVGIYVGNGLVIHSPTSGKVVCYTSVSRFTCGVRY